MKKIITILAIFSILFTGNFAHAVGNNSSDQSGDVNTPDGVIKGSDTSSSPTAVPTDNSNAGSVTNGGATPASPGSAGSVTNTGTSNTQTTATTPVNTTLDYSGWVQCDGVISKNEPNRNVPCNFINLMKMVNYLINWAFALVIPILVGLFSYAGFLLMTGKDKDRTKAKDMLWNAIIGFAIMLISWFVVRTALGWIVNSDFIDTATKLIGK